MREQKLVRGKERGREYRREESPVKIGSRQQAGRQVCTNARAEVYIGKHRWDMVLWKECRSLFEHTQAYTTSFHTLR
jgi:hypothetical protein